jgi:Tol biopolymer transport system component
MVRRAVTRTPRSSPWLPLALTLIAAPVLAQTPTTRQVSGSAFPVPRFIGVDAPCFSRRGSISGDGRFVAFDSIGTNVVNGDTNGHTDVFLRDVVANTSLRVSLTQSAGQGNNDSFNAAVSATGRFIAFESRASNLVPGDTNAASDVFVRDLGFGGTVSRVSVTATGGQITGASFSPAISADGRYVAFASSAANVVAGDTNGAMDVFVRDRVAGTTELVSVSSSGQVANGGSAKPVISADGRYVAFTSGASNLVANDTNGVADIFVRDRVLRATERVSVPPLVGQANGPSTACDISGDGRYVAFDSTATNLVGGDTNGVSDVFVRDRVAGVTTRASASTGGAEGNGASREPALSADGRYVAFVTDATNLGLLSDVHAGADIYLHDLLSGDTQIVSIDANGAQFVGNTPFGHPSINAGGRFVVFDGLGLSSPQTSRVVWLRDRAIVPGVSLSVSEASATEGGGLAGAGTLLFSVNLSARTTRNVTFRYWTEDVTTRAGSDYVRTVGTASIPPGAIATTIGVPVIGDSTCELARAMHLNIDVPDNATIADGQGTGTIRDDDCLTLMIGTFELSPEDAVVTAGEQVTYALSWTVPSGSWRSLDSLELRIGEGGELVWVRFDETTRTFAVVDPSTGRSSPAFAGGSPNVLAAGGAHVRLADTGFVTAGPDSPEVTLLVTLALGEAAAGATYPVEVQATSDAGQASGFEPRTSMTVVSRRPFQPR